MTPEKLQEKLADHAGKLQNSLEVIDAEKRKIRKLTDDSLTMFRQLTKLRREDGS